MKAKIQKVLIGIDPDVDKNGVAYKEGDIIELSNLTFFQLFDYLQFVKKTAEEKKIPYFVVIEGGWLNKSNWHKSENGTAALNAKIGSHTGANHEVGKKIVEMLEYLDMKNNTVIVKPRKSKVNAKLFGMMTGIKTKTNQEARDAYMLIHGL